MRRTADFDFFLPKERIAQTPPVERGASRLMHLTREGRCMHRHFSELVELIPANAVLVVNDTRVIPARLRARKPTGGAVELLLCEPAESGTEGYEHWYCLARSSKALRAGTDLEIVGTNRTCRVVRERAPDGEESRVVVAFSGDVFALLAAVGEVPLPPYIERPGGTTPTDRERYQTVFAEREGAIAAPTAGLHFTPEVLSRLKERGVTIARVTLHVGLGTFAPVRVDNVADIVLHEERYEVPERTKELVASGRPVVAVGTTCVRALESAAVGPKEVRAGSGRTRLFISPGYDFQIVDTLVTNFHLPQSTLLMMVCAFAGTDAVLRAYNEAVEREYRFFSYGDAMLLERYES